MIITIDGPAASGKSTIARIIAQKQGMVHLNTGLLYRALAFLLHDSIFSSENMLFEEKVITECLAHINYVYDNYASIYYKGRDITAHLKNATCDIAASRISEEKQIREAVNFFARDFAKVHTIIADGRDCGTVVFPDAEYKFFITATCDIRAVRWQNDQKSRGVVCDLEQALHLLQERDARDTQRVIAPLRVPSDARVIDTSALSIESVVKMIIDSVSVDKV